MNEHTKGKWEWREYAAPKDHFFIMKSGTMPALHIAEMNSNKIPLDETVANAEHIVHCVNNFDALVEALEDIKTFLAFERNNAVMRETIASIVTEALLATHTQEEAGSDEYGRNPQPRPMDESESG